ncbi:MAG: 16S rRNA (adenine(1518)-N(6)/adenine(1519)-N(6))-dimethyltransferase RsmA, partial [Clostridia bacterium]|nr:16S rRNA (adenine(1518)-N(6)/adenine(1519)-N(6))-dimethyltransferase RsmA [Clostridia bacterium]
MDFISPSVIKRIASKYGFVFKKGLGQNFLSSQDVLEEIAIAAEIDDSGVIEIGPGFGVLTNELAKRAKKVLALEIDERLIPILADTLGEYDNVKVINQDVLKTDVKKLIEEEFGGEKVSVAANLPYYITTPIITGLIEGQLPLKNLVVMVQKEVADRITAEPGSKNYGAISVLCQYYTKAELITVVGANEFVPPPKVDSAVVKMAFRDEPAVSVKDEKMFFRTVKAAFSQRRKTLLNCLVANFPHNKEEISEIMTSIGIEPARRGETLSLEEFAKLSDVLFKV